ncbi:hypothetical protein F5Y06DRAFT_302441 [Hypoxylon sp. FL0890]|nr:hypothetical protein F5Y06DRAFT_302441 [Hypoxylon sp. FL0890]
MLGHRSAAHQVQYRPSCGTVISHKEFLELVDSHGRDFTTELKQLRVPMPFDGNYTQELYAQQSFNFVDVAYWLRADAAFGKQAVLLNQSDDLQGLSRPLLLISLPTKVPESFGKSSDCVLSSYANTTRKLGLRILAWSLERSGLLAQAAAIGDYYYSIIANDTHEDNNMYRFFDVLARQIGVEGSFLDRSAPVSLYANCFGLF